MTQRSFSALGLIAFIAVVCLAGCSDEGSESEDRARLGRMELDIRDYADDPLCDGVGDCRFIGMGVNPCGGPWYYLIYSTSSADSLVLTEMVAAYNQYNDDLNRKYGWAGPCVVPNPPNLGCRDGMCVDLGAEPE